MTSQCSRPAVATVTIAGRDIARCDTCSWVSPPGEDADGPSAESHRQAAAGVRSA